MMMFLKRRMVAFLVMSLKLLCCETRDYIIIVFPWRSTVWVDIINYNLLTVEVTDFVQGLFKLNSMLWTNKNGVNLKRSHVF